MSFFAKKHAKVLIICEISAQLHFLTLTLTQFELRVLLVDDEQPTFTTYDLTVGGALL